MSKTVILKKNDEVILPITTYDNVLGHPEITEVVTKDGKLPTSKAVSDYVDEKIGDISSEFVDSSIHIGDTEPAIKTKLWIDTTDDNLEKVETNSEVITSIQNAVYTLQQQVSKLMLLRTNGVISGNVTDSTFTELANSADPQIPDIIADEEEEYGDAIEYPAYAAESEPTVNHVTIKMGTWQEIQASKKYFINGELVWCTDRSAMYIYVNGSFKKVASSSTSPDEPIIDDDTMDTTELQQYLDNLDHINFIPVKDPNSKYTVRVNEYGNLIVYDSNNDSVLNAPSTRGLYFPGFDDGTGAIGELKINAFYLGGLDNDEHSYQPCSHNFVELANISYHDINLNGLCLMYTYNDSTWFKLPLWGVCKAQSTFLIRGAQCSVMDVNTTKLKVKTFNMEWIVDGSPIKFDRGNQKAAFYLCWCDLSTENNMIYVMSGDDNIKVDYPSSPASLLDRKGGKTALGYVELLGVGGTTYCENATYAMPSGKSIDANCLFIKKYVLDPVTQSNGKGVSKLNNKKYLQCIDLSEVNSDHVERYTPKASFENKNLSTDKHNFDPNKPNTLTCSFGIQATDNSSTGGPGATRCFNWNSVGYYDEYLWFKKKTDTEWIKIESYKEGVNYNTLQRSTDPECIKGETSYPEYYTRIRWETFYGDPMTTHKVMIAGLTAGTYEYKVGRADENGNPTDYISKTREFTVKSDAEVTSFDFIQTTDQQGANWEEYQVWDLSSDFINRNERVGQTPSVASGEPSPGVNIRDFDFTINTGDITYNGSRPNEWIDYYSGYKYIDDKEEMFTIGNNDLAPIPKDRNASGNLKVLGMMILGYGRERPDKISHFVNDLFYTQEMDVKNPPIFRGEAFDTTAEKNYRVPALYSFNYGKFHFISLNSEIRTGYPDSNPDALNYTPSTVTGEFGVKDPYNGNKSVAYQKVEDWLVRDLLIWKNNGSLPASYDPEHPEDSRLAPQNCQKAIIYTHEMPFTITAAGTYGKYIRPDADGSVFRESSKANLNTKHGFQFQRLFKLWGIRLIFGGHKHTCSISMPIYDAPGSYIPYSSSPSDLMQNISGADSFNPIIQVVRGDTDPEWGVDAKIGHAIENFDQWRGNIFNSTNEDVTVNLTNGTQTIPAMSTNASDSDKPLCRYEIVDSVSAPTYVMCQATGYKNISNSDTSDGPEHCQWQRAMVQGQRLNTTTWEGEDLSEEDRSAQLYPFYTRFHITDDAIHVDLQRVAGLYKPNSKAGYWDVSKNMPNGHEAKMNELHRSTWKSCTISLD